MHDTDPADAHALREPGSRMITAPFVAVTAVTFLFFLYVGVQVPLIPRFIEDGLGGSEVDVGLNLAVFSVSAIAVRPVLGPWGDRYGRRILMIGGSALAAVGIIAAAFVTSRWVLLPLRALCGIGEGALFVGAATMINDLAPAQRRAEAASYFSVAVFGGLGVGPIIGETLASDDDFTRGLVVAGVFALAAAALAFVVPRGAADLALDGPEHESIDGEARPSLHGRPAHRFHRAAIRPGLVLALAIGGYATFNAFIPDHSRDVGLSGSMWVFATYSVICLVVRLLGAKLPERMGLARAITAALVLLAAGLTVLAGFGSPAGLFAGATLIGFGMSFLYPALMALTVNAAPDRERAQVISTFTMFFEVGIAAGAMAFGLVAEVTGKRGGFLGGALATIVGLWFLWRRLLPSLRLRPIPASEAAVGSAH